MTKLKKLSRAQQMAKSRYMPITWVLYDAGNTNLKESLKSTKHQDLNDLGVFHSSLEVRKQ